MASQQPSQPREKQNESQHSEDSSAGQTKLPIDEIRRAVENVRYGYVSLIIQDSRIVQIEVLDKTRLI